MGDAVVDGLSDRGSTPLRSTLESDLKKSGKPYKHWKKGDFDNTLFLPNFIRGNQRGNQKDRPMLVKAWSIYFFCSSKCRKLFAGVFDFYNLTKNQYLSLAIHTTDTHKNQRYDKRAIRVVRTTERKLL